MLVVLGVVVSLEMDGGCEVMVVMVWDLYEY